MEVGAPKIGLFFGSFNPIHLGHLIIANYFVTETDLEKIWFVVSPQNPLKSAAELANVEHRLAMVELAISENPAFQASDVELYMPWPSYTIDTLNKLSNIFPNHQFVLLMGSDNLEIFPKWKQYREILEKYEIYVYARPGHPMPEGEFQDSVKWFSAMEMGISATYIRQNAGKNRSIQYLVAEKVRKYIEAKRLYV